MQHALTDDRRRDIRSKAAKYTIPVLINLADKCDAENMPAEAKYIRDLIAERRAYRADAPPKQRSAATQPVMQERNTAPWLTPDRAKALVLSGGILAGGGYIMAAIVFPALVAVISFIYSNALLIGGGIASAIVILSLRGGEKKTEFQSQAPPQNFAPPEGWACMEQTQRIWFPKK